MVEGSFQYTSQNHLRFGRFTGDGAASDTFVTMIGKCSRKPESPLDEAIRAAKEIHSAFGSDLVLCMSGGVDSECMALAFLAAKVPFRVAIAKFENGLNEEDIKHAISFCSLNKIAVEIVGIDLEQFFESGKHIEYAQAYQCRSPQLAVHIELLRRIDGVPVMSWNPTQIDLKNSSRDLRFLLPSEPYVSYLRFFAKEKRAGVPFFFAYTPELIYSFFWTKRFQQELVLAEQEIKRARSFLGPIDRLMKRRKRPVTTYDGKIAQYRQGGFQVEPRDRKRTGFEEAKVYFRELFIRKGLIEPDFRFEPFDYYYRRPLEKLFPYPRDYAQIIPTDYFPRPDLLERFKQSSQGNG